MRDIIIAVLVNFVAFIPIVHLWGTLDGKQISLVDSIYYVGLCSAIVAAIFAYGGLCVLINKRRGDRSL